MSPSWRNPWGMTTHNETRERKIFLNRVPE